MDEHHWGGLRVICKNEFLQPAPQPGHMVPGSLGGSFQGKRYSADSQKHLEIQSAADSLDYWCQVQKENSSKSER